MSSNIIYPQGGLAVDIVVPNGQSIAVYAKSTAQIYQINGYSNQPLSRTLIQTIESEEIVLGPFSEETTLQIESGPYITYYQIGENPTITELKGLRTQPLPFGTLSTSATLPIALMLRGIVIISPGGNINVDMELGTVVETATDFEVDDSFDWSAINLGGGTATAFSSTGHAYVGNSVLSSNESATFRTVKIAENEFITYRIGG